MDDAAIFVDLGVLYVCSDRRRDGGRRLINPSVDARPQNAGPDVKHLTAQFLFGQPLGLQPKPPHGRIDCNATILAPARAGARPSRPCAAPSLKKEHREDSPKSRRRISTFKFVVIRLSSVAEILNILPDASLDDRPIRPIARRNPRGLCQTQKSSITRICAADEWFD